MTTITLVLFLAGIGWACLAPSSPSRKASPTALRVARQWLRVLTCRVVSLSRRVAPTGPERAVRLREHAGGALITSDEGAQPTQRARPVHPARALKTAHPLVPPAAPLPPDPTAQLDAWVRRELRNPRDKRMRAHVTKEAMKVHRVSRRTAQRAVQRVAGGAR